jgi:hypothetical protein|tara:strand:- start:522 stop:788 length:267 start_codon:yes stop_codon:yes gene_type:complete
MKKVQTLFVVVVVWRLGGKKEEGLLFVVEKEKPKIKKKCKNLSPFLGFTFSSRGQQEEKKSNFFSPKLLFPRSVRRRGGGFRGFTPPW